ncbi:hypothetical protein L596_001150 [Steinernema carpocapsae]|uniref:RING-type E3 ubiquitin transferase n=1 Tax=Steinernema carpocapsae TaxID=34508 RepID=A0A4U8UKR3_STECR|nr:hypothetical protein L596_001150 [Steinernema carpocapsae]
MSSKPEHLSPVESFKNKETNAVLKEPKNKNTKSVKPKRSQKPALTCTEAKNLKQVLVDKKVKPEKKPSSPNVDVQRQQAEERLSRQRYKAKVSVDRSCIESIRDNLLCSICKSFFDNPIMTWCGHNFCVNCIKQYLTVVTKKKLANDIIADDGKAEEKPQCPICRSDKVVTYALDFTLKAIVDDYVLRYPDDPDVAYPHDDRCLRSPVRPKSKRDLSLPLPPTNSLLG